jgi:nitrogen fixation protein FixH
VKEIIFATSLKEQFKLKVTLFCIYGIFLSFVIGYAVFATVTFDGAIDHSYEKGMAYPQKLAKLQELNWQFQPGEHQFRTGEEGHLELWIRDKYNNPVHDVSVQFEVNRPASQESIPTQTAREMEPGHYITSIQVPRLGHWLVKAIVVHDQVQVEHEFRIYVNKG